MDNEPSIISNTDHLEIVFKTQRIVTEPGYVSGMIELLRSMNPKEVTLKIRMSDSLMIPPGTITMDQAIEEMLKIQGIMLT